MSYNPNNPNGQATMANSAPVVLASDQTAVPVTDNSGSLTVDDGGSSITIDGAVSQTGTWNINNISGTISLPTGAATEATLLDIESALGGTLDVNVIGGGGGAVTITDGVDTADVMEVDDTMTGTHKGLVTNSVIYGLSTAGGGAFVEVKVTPSGALTVDTAIDQPLTDTELRASPVEVDVTNASITVTGTVTANAGTNLNTSALALESTLSSLNTKVTAVNTGAVVVSSSALPSGASTSANQSTIIGHVDGIETLLGTIDADTGNISTKIDTLAGAVTGTEMQVDIVSAPTLTIQATNLDIRDLTSASDSVAAVQSGTWNIGTLSTITNVVHVDDNSGSLTVDAPVGTPVFVRLSDGASPITTLPVSLTSTTITGTVAVTQSGTWDEVGINDSGNSITVDAIDLDIRNLSAATDSVSVHGDVGIADQLDLTNSNPFVVAIVDANGDQITSFGGGTQYTEDAAAAANPVGTAVNLVRADTPATITTTDGDNVAQRGTNYGAAYVQIVSSSGSFVDSFGGGTQYTEGDTDATITGTAMLMEVAANALQPVQGTVADGLLVNLGSNNDVTINNAAGASAVNIQDGGNTITVDGTVAATQSGAWNVTNISGTVSLPTGASTLAEQQSQTTALQIMDDWDESDRAKVNVIVGQAGIAGGEGATGANVIRMVPANAVVSTANSSTATLGGSAAFTGTGEDVSAYQEIRVNVISNVASATDGLSLQQSSDNSNWDIIDTYTVAAATGKTFSIPRQARYFRVVYTNGGGAQASFRLQTIYNRYSSKSSSQRAGDTYSNETDLEQSQSFLMGYNGSTWDRLRSDTTNGLDVDVTRVTGTVTVTNSPATSGGFTTYHLVSAGTTNATNVKNAAGQLFGWQIYNNNSAVRKLAFHNSASAPTAGASVFFSIVMPGNSGANVFNDTGIAFSAGIGITTVTGIADSDTAAVGANDLTINLFYK